MRLQIRPSRAISVLAALTVLVIAVAVTLLILDMRKRAIEAARLDTLAFTHMVREETEHTFDQADLVLRGVQERMQTAYGGRLELASPAVRLLLVARISALSQVDELFLLDASGAMVNSSRSDGTLPATHADTAYFKAFAGGPAEGLFIGKPLRAAAHAGWVLHIARSFTGRNGEFRGVAVAVLNLDRLEDLYRGMKADHPRPMSLYLDDGTLAVSLPHRENLVGAYAPELGNDPLPSSGGELRIVDYPTGDGDRRAFVLARTGRFPLFVGVPGGEELALAEWRESSFVVFLGAFLVCGVVVVAAWLLVRGVTRQVELTRALRDANDRYHQTFNSVMDAIVAVDATQKIMLFNPAAERMFGLAQSEVLGRPLSRIVPDRTREAHGLKVNGFMQTGDEARAMDGTGRRANGTEFPFECTISQTLIGGKPQLTAVLRDITERRRAEEDLREMNRQLRQLSASLQRVREQERARIAMELHDELGQQLTGLKLELSWLAGRMKDGRETTQHEVLTMRHLLDAAIASVRRLATDLRPPILDDLGFGEAVAWHTAEFTKRSGLQVVLDLQAQELVKEDVVATALFRIVQESLTNVVRHAGATRVQVCLTADGQELFLTVSDDGSGIAAGARPGSGIGLVSMRERAVALGGRFEIRSVPGVGTTIRVALPLRSPALEREAA